MLHNSVSLPDAKNSPFTVYELLRCNHCVQTQNLSFVEQERSTYFPHQARLPESV